MAVDVCPLILVEPVTEAEGAGKASTSPLSLPRGTSGVGRRVGGGLGDVAATQTQRGSLGYTNVIGYL